MLLSLRITNWSDIARFNNNNNKIFCFTMCAPCLSNSIVSRNKKLFLSFFVFRNNWYFRKYSTGDFGSSSLRFTKQNARRKFSEKPAENRFFTTTTKCRPQKCLSHTTTTLFTFEKWLALNNNQKKNVSSIFPNTRTTKKQNEKKTTKIICKLRTLLNWEN